MKRWLAILLIIGAISETSAQTYYVDATNGDDTWSGKLPSTQGTDGPWKTLSKVSNAQSLLAPGDSVLFKCGETWRGQLNIAKSGTSGNSITYSNYGTCDGTNKPEIRASQLATSWSVYSGNIYVANVSTAAKQVFVDGQYIKPAQYPNSGYLIIDTDSKDSSGNAAYNFLVDSDLSAIGNQDLVGAGIHIRTINWRVEDRTVNAFDASTNKLSWSANTAYAIYKNYGYYLDNKLWMLDAPGEWYYDASQGKLYVWLRDSTDPTAHLIEASTLDYAITDSNSSYVTIDGLSIKHAALDGVTFSSAPNFVARNLEISDSGRRGLVITGSANGSVQNSLITNSVNEGIEIQNSSGTAVTGNQVLNSGTVGSPRNSLAGIDSQASDGVTIANNTVTNAGYIGIRFLRNSTISNNDVENVCLVLDDCGGIYSWAYTGSSSTLASPLNSTVTNNIVVNVLGNTQGRPAGPTWVKGLYLDDYSNGLTVTNNTVVNSDVGILLHNAYNNVVQGNVTYGNRQYEVYLVESGNVTGGVLQGNVITNNILFPWIYTPYIGLYSPFQEITLSGSNRNAFDTNRYSSVYSGVLVRDTVGLTYPPNPLYFTLAQWQQPFPSGRNEDLNSTSFDAGVAQYEQLDLIAPNFINNSTFDAGISGWTVSSGSRIDSVSACASGGDCLMLTTSTTRGLTSGNNFSVQKGKTYFVRADLRGSQANQGLLLVAREGGPASFNNLGLDKSITVGSDWNTYTFTFMATGDDVLGVGANYNGANLNFIIGAGQQLYIDNVAIQEASAVFNDPNDDSAILINRNATTTAMDCPIDATHTEAMCSEYALFDDGTPVVWPLTVPARSSKVVVWANNPLKDSDRDGISDNADQCPGTPIATPVDENGCSFAQQHYRADLSARISAPASVNQGQTITYNVTVTNASTSTASATNVQVAGLSGCALTSNTIAIGASANCSVTVTASAPGTTTQSVSVSGAEYDPNPNNNIDGVTTTVNPVADLAIQISGSPSPATLGQAISYTLTVTNNGPSTATNVSTGGSLPNCTTIDLGTLTSGQSKTCTRSVTPSAVGTLTQTVTVSDNETDLNTANNSASVSTTVNAPDLVPTAMSGTKSGSKVYVSDTVKNQGSSTASAFTVSYYLSTNTTYDAGTDLALVTTSTGTTPCTRIISSLAIGATSSVSNKLCYRPSSAKTSVNYYVLTVDDATRQVIESNETNNVKATTGTLKW